MQPKKLDSKLLTPGSLPRLDIPRVGVTKRQKTYADSGRIIKTHRIRTEAGFEHYCIGVVCCYFLSNWYDFSQIESESFLVLEASPLCLQSRMPEVASCTTPIPPATSIHHSKKVSKPCFGSASYIFQFRLMKAFNSAKNSSMGLRSGEYGGQVY